MRFGFLTILIVGLLGLHPAAAQDGGVGHTFQIDSQASRIMVRLDRKGLLSAFSHDHLLVAEGIAGRIFLDEEDISRSSLLLSVPVDSIVVDPPAERQREGITGEMDDGDREDTRENMLSGEYLDAANHPRIVATAERISGELPLLSIPIMLRIKESERELILPVRVTIENLTLRAVGEVRFLQSEYGVEPFSNLLGTLAVEDEILVKFDIVATRQP